MITPKVIITVAPTGGVGGKDPNPHRPTQPEEIASTVYNCYNAGASICALHVRRPDDRATCDPAIYRRTNELIREKCNIILNNSTGGGVDGDMTSVVREELEEILYDQRVKGLEGGAEMATFDGHSIMTSFGGRNVLMDTNTGRCDDLAERFRTKGVKPEWEVFSVAHILQDPIRLIEAGYDEPPYYFNIVLNTKGFQGAYPFTPKLLQIMVDHLPEKATFCVSGIAQAQFPAAMNSILLGGHVRVGLEDNLFLSKGVLGSNEQFVDKLVRLIREMGAEPATPDEAREILGLSCVSAGDPLS